MRICKEYCLNYKTSNIEIGVAGFFWCVGCFAATLPKRWSEPEIDLSISSVNPRKDEWAFDYQLVDGKSHSATALRRDVLG